MKEQQLFSLVRQAIDTYHMIEEGDEIALGLSGGKDCLTLLYALAKMRSFYPKSFELVAITVDLGFHNVDFEEVEHYCSSLAVPYYVVKTQIADIVFEARKESNPCSLCANMRKGALNNRALELGCNKIAYAHHKDDLLESMMMSFLYEGRLHTFSPVTHLDKTGLTLIRPLLFCFEGQIKGFVNRYQLPVVKSPCPVDGTTKREYVKTLINQINYEQKGSKNHMFRAVMDGIVNVECPPTSKVEE